MPPEPPTGRAWRIRELAAGEESAWDEFVRAHPRGSPFHLMAWRACLARTFGYTPLYLVAESDGGRWGAVLPLFECRGWFSGKAWISTPFAVYGGVLARGGGAAAAMRGALEARAAAAAVQYVELRNGWEEQRLGFEPVRRYATYVLPLRAAGQEELLACLPGKTRNMVRKALKTEFAVRRGVRHAGAFAELHARTLHRLGTPVFPPAHYQRILDAFGPEAELAEVHCGGELAAASLSFLYGDSAHIYYAGADPRYNHLAANYAMYNAHLLDAARRGFACFDFGRARHGAGTARFKKHWAAVMRELPYEMLLVRRRALPELTPGNAYFSPVIGLWRRLPFWLTRRLGPLLVRQFP